MKLRYLTAGESHGMGLTAILEGIPANLTLTEKDINIQLKRRQQGYGRGGRMKIETDKATITSGVRHGKTLGSPIALWVENKDYKSWNKEMANHAIKGFKSKKALTYPRPGHADLNGGLKYNQTDLRNILERASARETAIRVAIGAVCRQFLATFGIDVTSHVTAIGSACLEDIKQDFSLIKTKQEKSPVRCIDPKTAKQMMTLIDQARLKGDSLGGEFEVLFKGLPPGLGSHTHWDNKLDAQMTQTLMSLQAIKGVEVGLGFDVAYLKGSEVHDGIKYCKRKKQFQRLTNNAGGFEGGMTTGELIVLRAAMKPIATLMQPLMSVDIKTKAPKKASVERSDTCAVPAAAVIAENILCVDIANAFLEKFGGDSIEETMRNYEGFLGQIRRW